MPASRTASCLLGCAALLFAVSANATSWQWRDASGRMVYSDRAPPPEVRASQIVRAPLQPGSFGPAANTATPATGSPGGAGASSMVSSTPVAAPGAAPQKPSWAERELASRKKAAEREENEAKLQKQREHDEANRRACTEMRNTLRALESGRRLSVVNARGESEVIDDAERSRRVETTRKDIERSCSTPPVAASN